MKKIELLAPAGSWESLVATVKGGADAVYLAGQQFGARKSAQNFTDETLLEAIDYCHLRGVKVYLTVNTLLSDEELQSLEPFLTPLYRNGIDAFIVQDLGVFQYLRKLYPNVEIHCSTQMALHSVEDMKAVKAMGADRAVLPRELNLEQINEIHRSVDIELEAFVHGALCVSVSGQCLMSSMIGGRSGNRGSCAQSCRQRYKLVKSSTEETILSKDGDYLISPKDLMTIEQLKEIVDAGVTSLKIEGRMKGPEYSYAVTKAYRLMLDSVLENKEMDSVQLENLMEEMRRIFNRNFTKGFLMGTTNKDYISQETPGNRGILIGEVVSYDKRNAEMVLELSERINKGDDLQVRQKQGSVGGRVEYLKKDGKRIETMDGGNSVIVNFKHEVNKGTQVYRTYDQLLMKDIQLKINDTERTTGVYLRFEMKAGSAPILEISHESGIRVTVTADILAEVALKTPLADDRIQEQLEKMGGTPFRTEQVTIVREGNETMPIKIINQLRRDGVEALTEALLITTRRHEDILSDVPALNVNTADGEEDLSDEEYMNQLLGDQKLVMTAMVRTTEQYKACAELGIKTIYVYNLFESDKATTENEDSFVDKDWVQNWITVIGMYPDVKTIPYLGRFTFTKELHARVEVLKELKEFDTVLVSAIGQLEYAKENGFATVADFSMNLFNHMTDRLLNHEGVVRSTLSLELNDEQIDHILEQHGEARPIEIIGYGKIPVMVNQFCPINGIYSKDKTGCQICRKDDYYLEDKTGARFLVKGNAHCQVEIFNSAILNLADEWKYLEQLGLSSYRLNFVNEGVDEVNEVIEMHLKASLNFPIELRGKGYTKGHFKRGVI